MLPTTGFKEICAGHAGNNTEVETIHTNKHPYCKLLQRGVGKQLRRRQAGSDCRLLDLLSMARRRCRVHSALSSRRKPDSDLSLILIMIPSAEVEVTCFLSTFHV